MNAPDAFHEQALHDAIAGTTATAPTFRLARHFSLAALVCIVIAAALLALSYRNSAVDDLIDAVEDENITLARTMGNALLPEFGPFLLAAPAYPAEVLRQHPDLQRLDQAVATLKNGLDIAHVRIFGRGGRVIYSSDSLDLARHPAPSDGLDQALAGRATTAFHTKDASGDPLANPGIAETTVPIVVPGSDDVIAVFELHRDLRPLLQRIDMTQLKVAAAAAGILLLLFAALSLIVRRADGILRQQAMALRRTGERYRLLFDANPHPIWLRDPASGRVLAANETALREYRYSRDAFMALGASELPLTNASPMQRGHIRHRRADGSEFYVATFSQSFESAGKLVDIVLAENISARVQAEMERDRLDRTLRMVGECNQLLVRAQDDEELRQGICRIIADAGDFAMVWVAIADNDGYMLPAAHAGRDSARLWPLVLAGLSGGRDDLGAMLNCSAATHGMLCESCDVRTKPQCSKALRAFGDAGAPACTSLPLRRNGRLIGTLMLHSDRMETLPTTALATLTELADDLAFGLAAHRDRRSLHESEERLRMALAAASMTTWQWDVASDRLTLGDNAAVLIGPPGVDGQFPDIRQHIFGADRDAFIAAAMASVKEGRDFNSEFRIVRTDGRIAWVEAVGRPVRDAAGRVAHLTGVSRDITQRRQSDEALRLRQRAMEASSEGIVIHDVTAKGSPASWVNPAFERITGYAASEIVGHCGRELVARGHRRLARTNFFAALRRGGESEALLRCVRKDGVEFWGEVSIAPVRNDSGRVTHLLTMVRDVSDRIAHEEQLSHNASHDALTGLANHERFADRLSQALIHDRRLGRMAAVLSLDLDRFKLVNDSLGHQGGDDLLRTIAARLVATVRPGDTVARVGGNEFAILLTDLADERDLTTIAGNVLACIDEHVEVDGQRFSLTASIGISVHPRDGNDAETLLRSADAAMGRSKAGGGDAFTFYTSEMNIRAEERLKLESSIRHAIEHNEFVLHYQPQMCLQSGRITGVEALVRWQHPERGLLGPNEFIPVAEETGLIMRIGNWVMDTAAAQAVAWQRAGLGVLRVAVNVSARQLIGAQLIDRVAEVLKETGLVPSLLELELTETAVMRNPEEAQETLRAIRAMGVSLAMDDFGTGYSSLSHLRRFPFNVLKIDRSFVNGIVSDPDDALVVRSIVSMSTSLGLDVVAEGVETEAQAAVLVNAGCASIQGYWLSRPIAPDSLAELVRAHLPAHALPGGLKPLSRHSLLLVDDEPHVLSALRRLFYKDGYDILTAENAEVALELLAMHSVAVVIADQRMPKTSGTELLKRVKRMYPETIRIVLSGYTELNSVTDAINEGAIYKFITKPWDDVQLRELVRSAFEHHELARANRRCEIF